MLTLAIRGLAGTKTADGLDSYDPHPVGWGTQVDADTLITLFPSGHTRTGLAVGLSGMNYWVPNHGVAYGGELRLGLGRRRWGVPLMEPKLLGLLGPSSCRFERMDMVVDFVRWRLRGLTDLTGPDHVTELDSGISLLVASQRFVLEGWGWKWSLSLLDFRLRPTFHWGASASVEWSINAVVFGGTVGAHFLPDARVFATANVGLLFELGQGVGL